MRLDLFLNRTYLVKCKRVASAFCKEGLIHVNGLSRRANHEIYIGDEIFMSLLGRTIRLQVLHLPTNNINKGQQWSYVELIEEQLAIADAYHTTNSPTFRQKTSTNH